MSHLPSPPPECIDSNVTQMADSQDGCTIAYALPLTPLSLELLMRKQVSRILIIDDDQALLTGLTEMLQLCLWRAEIETCSHPASAVSIAQDGNYDLILCDCWMPETSGLDLLPRLRQAAPHASILMMSGAVNDAVQKTALSRGARQVLAKPFDRQSLTSLLKQALKDHHATEST